jgi:hydrogenase nickel incorporation protein HypA/HybF
MHEVSLASGLIEIVSGQCKKNGYQRIDSVNVKIGRASGILPDALTFAFDAMKGDSLAKDAVLYIEEVLVGGHCRDCNSDFAVEEEYVLQCPRCGGLSFDVTAGREMDIVDMEVS